MMRDLPHLAARLFGTPLLIDPRKLDAIVPAFLKRLNGEDDEPEGAPASPRQPVIANGIAVIPVIGTLVRRKTMLDAYSGLTSYGDLRESIQCALDDARARAILLDIDSFGGEAPGCFEFCDWLFAQRGNKPIWAVADVDALSAGYAIMAQADRVLVAPSGSAGSIGAVAVHCERSQYNEAMGFSYTVIRAGLRKAELNAYEPLTREAAEKVQGSLDKLRDNFARSVVRARSGLSSKAALGTEGQWFEADDALRLKLVDGIATYEDAFAQLSQSVPPAQSAAAPPPVAAPIPIEDEPSNPEDLPEEEIMPPTTASDPRPSPDPPPAPTPTPTPTPTEPSKPPEVVSFDDARRQGREAHAAEVREISEMCMIFGRPALAASFIAEGKSVAAVRRDLIDLRAKEEHEQQGSTSNQLGGGTTAQTPASIEQSWDKAFANARSWMPEQYR